MKTYYSCGNVLWYLRFAIARLLIGGGTCAFNLRIENGGIVVRSRAHAVFSNVVIIGAETAFTFTED